MSTYVLTFESTHAAMASSKTLASGGFDFWTIPTPREISAGCGMALRFSADSPESFVARVFGSNRVAPTGKAKLYVQVEKDVYRLEESL